MKIRKKFLPLALCAVLLFGIGCGTTEEPVNPGEEYVPFDYDAKHDAADNVLRFFSSDDGLDAFLNDFFERHMRYNEKRIHSFPIGAAQPIWKEWESMIGSFWDASADNLSSFYATNEWVEKWLKFDYMSVQDRQGYISTSTGITSTDWGQGWAFPDYHNAPSPIGYEFSSGTEGWEADGRTRVSSYAAAADGTLAADAGIERYLKAETSGSASEIAVVSPEFSSEAFYSPFLNFSWNYNVVGSSNLDDLYVYFQTEDDRTWTDDKCVSYSDYASRSLSMEDGNKVWQGTFLPMFLNTEWGRDSMTSKKVTRLKFVLRAREGKTFSGQMLFNFIRGDFDDRLADNCGEYIVAAKNFLSYTQNKELLETVLPVARRAMQFYLTSLGGEDGIVSTESLVGHFATGTASTGVGIGNGFWDAISFPKVNFYTNITYYQALKSLVYLERMAEHYGVESEPVKVLGSDMKTETEYAETADSLEERMEVCRNEMRSYFWDAEKGRFFAGYYDENDGIGTTDRKMDYGFLLFNLQAVADGIASDAQAEKIMEWVDGTREIAGDTSTGKDIYQYLFAPRFSTKNNLTDGVWAVGQAADWEVGVRNGGAVMQTSYYDVVARCSVLGASNAFGRLKGIQDFYDKVRAAGGKDQGFYRKYFDDLGIGMQGNFDRDGDGVGDGDSEGPIGIDCEFLEAALMFVCVPDAFFGLAPNFDGTLVVEPSVPEELDFWRLENLLFGGNSYDCSIGRYFVQFSNIKTESKLTTEVRLRKPGFDYAVYYNGIPVASTEREGRIVVRVPFANGKVEVKPAV